MGEVRARDELRKRADSAEALADDLENQITEFNMALDDALGRVAELEVIIQEVVEADDAANVELVEMGLPKGEGRLTEMMRQALTGDGSRIMDVVKAWRSMSDTERDYVVAHLANLGDQEGFFGQALDRQDKDV